jgi:WD40 repeat protein/serine/threonine protein kinase
MRLQRLSDGSPLVLRPENALGAGGEARIYAVLPGEQYVAKIYHRAEQGRAQKLQAMLANPPEDPLAAQGKLSIAWPLDLLHGADPEAQFAGYLMPRVSGVQPLFHCYNPGSRRRFYPTFDYLALYRVARNLAATVHALHSRGYVIGDVNESNILVSQSALITLVDTDSFQVVDSRTGRTFRCPVGKPEYTPPELQNLSFATTDRLPEHDRFGLAVLLFQLLMEGTHPFAGIYQGSEDPPPYAERIRAGHYPHASRSTPYRPAPTAPSLHLLHPAVRQLFTRCFEDGQTHPAARPEARTWLRVLLEAEEALLACVVNPRHRYGSHLAACPWCERTQRLGGRDPFPREADALPPPVRRLPAPVLRPPIPTFPAAIPAISPMGVVAAALPRSTYVPPPPATVRLPCNPWAWTTLICALLAFLAPTQNLPVLNLLAGIGAVFAGVRAFRQAPRYAGTGRWLASTAAVIGGAASLSIAPSLVREIHGPAAVRVLSANGGGIRALSFSPDGSTLAVAAERAEDQRLIGGQITLWNVRTGRVDQTLADDKGNFVAVAYMPSGKTLVTAVDSPFEKGAPFLLDALTRGTRHEFQGQQGHVSSVTCSSDGRFIVSGSDDRTVRIWDAHSGSLIGEKTLAGPIYTLACSPDSHLLAAGTVAPGRSIESGAVTVWDLTSLRRLWTHPAHSNGVLTVAFTPDSRWVATGGNDGMVRVWNGSTGELLRVLDGVGDAVTALACAPGSGLMAAGIAPRSGAGSVDQVHEIAVWNLSSGLRVKTLRGHRDLIDALAFSADGHILASGSRDTTLRLWRFP